MPRCHAGGSLTVALTDMWQVPHTQSAWSAGPAWPRFAARKIQLHDVYMLIEDFVYNLSVLRVQQALSVPLGV